MGFGCCSKYRCWLQKLSIHNLSSPVRVPLFTGIINNDHSWINDQMASIMITSKYIRTSRIVVAFCSKSGHKGRSFFTLMHFMRLKMWPYFFDNCCYVSCLLAVSGHSIDHMWWSAAGTLLVRSTQVGWSRRVRDALFACPFYRFIKSHLKFYTWLLILW